MDSTISPDRDAIIGSLAAMTIREEADYPYEQWLADKCGWSLDYARRVTLEYHRFLYLCTKQPATPSKDIDAAWHGHLMHSRHYFEILPQILGRPVHHTPGRAGQGAAEDRGKWLDQYERTLAAYEDVFCELPPKDIWPRPVARPTSARQPDQTQTQETDMKMIFYAAFLSAGLITMNAFSVSVPIQIAIAIAFLIFMALSYLGANQQAVREELSPRPRITKRNHAEARGHRKNTSRRDAGNTVIEGDDGLAGSAVFFHGASARGKTYHESSSHHDDWSDSSDSASSCGGSSCGGGCGGD